MKASTAPPGRADHRRPKKVSEMMQTKSPENEGCQDAQRGDRNRSSMQGFECVASDVLPLVSGGVLSDKTLVFQSTIFSKKIITVRARFLQCSSSLLEFTTFNGDSNVG